MSNLSMKSHQLGFFLLLILSSDLFAQTLVSEENSSSALSTVIPADASSGELVSQDNQYYQLQVLQQEVRTLRGLLEELNYQMQQIKQQQMDDYLDVDRRLIDLAKSSAATISTNVMGSQPTAVTDGQLGVTTVSNDGQQMVADNNMLVNVADEATMKADYDRASGLLLKSRDLDGAIVAFQSHIEMYPNSAYIPNAYYWLGEIYDLRDQKDLALQSFRIVVDIYTDHSKAMDARFKLGKLYHKMGQDQVAKQLLETAAQSNGGAAAKARAYLDTNPL